MAAGPGEDRRMWRKGTVEREGLSENNHRKLGLRTATISNHQIVARSDTRRIFDERAIATTSGDEQNRGDTELSHLNRTGSLGR